MAVQQYECDPRNYYVSGNCGGGVVVSSNYPPDGDVLVVHPTDFTGLTWGAIGSATPNASDTVDGRNNYGTFSAAFPASWFCQTLNALGYTDWYLPTTGEFQEIYNVRSEVPGLQQSATYWTSLETSAGAAWRFNMNLGVAQAFTKNLVAPVRCMRRPNVP